MAFSENGSAATKPVDTQRGFFETAKGWFSREKPQAGPDRLAVLSENLKDTDKKRLAAEIRHLKEKDREEKKPDLRAYSVSLFAEEISAGEVELLELTDLADIYSDHVASPPKKVDAGYTLRMVQKVSYYLGRNERDKANRADDFSYQREDPNSEKQQELQAKAKRLADKILNAPKKLSSDMAAFAGRLDAEVAGSREKFLAAPHGELMPEDLKKIIADHPDEYEAVVSKYELIALKAKMVEAPGMADCATALRNLESQFSSVDGTMLRTPDERLAYAETLTNPGEVKAKWYETRPPEYDKAFSREFISTELIPKAVAAKTPFEQVAKDIHWYQTAGSPDQMSTVKTRNYNLAGTYRHERVTVGSDSTTYVCPEAKIVPEMMAKFASQVESFSNQLEKSRASLLPEEFEKRVLQYACFVLHRFTSIHPMADGNGRTARSLYEYTIAKHLGPAKMAEYSVAHINEGNDTLPEDVKYLQVRMNENQTLTFYGSALGQKYRAAHPDSRKRVSFSDEPLMARLEEDDLEQEVFGDTGLVQFADRFKELIEAKKK